MTEDEAFIRTIVDSPGDDLPRLVYADWLDERNDPRGAYLRAELEWAKAKQTTGFIVLRLNGLAEGLDPVWVARVSRPPVGVCCELPVITNRGPQLTTADIEASEHRLGARFPSDYIGFMLNFNGGVPEWPVGEYSPLDEFHSDSGYVWRLSPLSEAHQWEMRPSDFLSEEAGRHLPQLLEPLTEWLSRFVIIGHNPDLIGGIFLGVAGAERGQIRILDTSVEIESGLRLHSSRPPNANSFTDFVVNLLKPSSLPPLPRLSPDND